MVKMGPPSHFFRFGSRGTQKKREASWTHFLKIGVNGGVKLPYLHFTWQTTNFKECCFNCLQAPGRLLKSETY